MLVKEWMIKSRNIYPVQFHILDSRVIRLSLKGSYYVNVNEKRAFNSSKGS